MAQGLPVKNAEQHWAVWDSTRLNNFPFRDDDIIIGTWSKSGTTWTQQLVAQLVFRGDPESYGQMLSPWPEFRIAPLEAAYEQAEAQTHRRFIKTHSPFNCVPYHESIKYLFIGRDARDVVWSMFNHHEIMNPEAFHLFNDAPGRVGPPWTHEIRDVHQFYLKFLEQGYMPGHTPDTNFWNCICQWWQVRDLPNVKLVHYNNLKQDFVGEAKKIADFLDIEIEESLWPQIEKHCSIDYMRDLSAKFEDLHIIFNGGGQNFINKGTNGRWKDVLSQEEVDRCDAIAIQEMGAQCAHWLKTGEMPPG